jgi:hypothetical protein
MHQGGSVIVTIDRAKWRTGRYGDSRSRSNEHVGLSRLLNTHGYRCCLGFLGQACGLSDDLALGVSQPDNVRGDADWPAALLDYGGLYALDRLDWESAFIALNDFPEPIDDSTREAWIAEGFRTVLNVSVEFVGEYPALDGAE